MATPHSQSASCSSGLRCGDVLKGKYEVLALIGTGGMSRVYLARDLELHNKQWAIKEVDRCATDPLGLPVEQSLISEAELLSRLQHPSIVGIADILKTDRFIYVIMDHVEGESLDQVVMRKGPQAEEDVQRWMLQICDALSYLHRQDPPIIYRDLKPNNIMLHPDGYVKLIDLGVAREYKPVQRRDTHAFGTMGYAAPEQYGKAQTDERTDIYGMGTTMWHLLSGSTPPPGFPLPNVRDENPAVGEGFADVIIPHCTQLKREDRYQSCDELAADLEARQELTREYRAKQRHRVMAFVALVAAAVLCVLIGASALFARDALITQDYQHHMDVAQASVQTDTALAQTELLAAIAQRPDAVSAYEELIGSYKLDGQFTPDEKRQFDAVYNDNLSALRAHERFAELSYELGRLYWYYYSYGQTGTYQENQATRIKASLEHFQSAAQDASFEDQATAQSYAGIAQFISGIDAAVMQGEEDQELYGSFWSSLSALAEQVRQEPLEIVQLDSCALITSAIETYMSRFHDIGTISTEEMEALLATVTEQLTSLQPVTEESKRMREEILERIRGDIPLKLAALKAAPQKEGSW